MKSPLKLSSEPKRVSAFEYQTEIVLGFDDFGESMNPLKSFLISESPQYSNPSRDIKYSKGSTGSILMDPIPASYRDICFKYPTILKNKYILGDTIVFILR